MMASADVDFEKIPASARKPDAYAEWNTKLAVRNLPTDKQRVLIVARHSDPALNEFTKLESVFSTVDTATRYGAGSIMHLMVTATTKTYAYAGLSLITVVDNKAGAAAIGRITPSGTANTQGVLRVSIANADALTVSIGAEDTAATIAAAVKAAIDAVSGSPVTAIIAEATMTLTVESKDTVGNTIRIETNNIAKGTTVTVVAATGDDIDPDITATLNIVVTKNHHIVAYGISGETDLLKLCTHLDTVTSPMEGRQAAGVYGQTGTLAQATTLTGCLNHGHIVSTWHRDVLSLPCELVAALAVMMASKEGPTRLLNTLALNSIGVCGSKNKTICTKQENALCSGITSIGTSPASTQAQVMRAITTYTKTISGMADESLLDAATVCALTYISCARIDRIVLRLPRNKLSDRAPPRVRSELIGVLMCCEELEILERVEENLPKLIMEHDLQNTGMLDRRVPSDATDSLHVVGMAIDLYL